MALRPYRIYRFEGVFDDKLLIADVPIIDLNKGTLVGEVLFFPKRAIERAATRHTKAASDWLMSQDWQRSDEPLPYGWYFVALDRNGSRPAAIVTFLAKPGVVPSFP